MFGVLTEITPAGRMNIKAVRFEGTPDRYGRYEVLRNGYETDSLIHQFEREMRHRYERRPNPLTFLPDKTPSIKKVIFNYSTTVVIWSDNTKTVVKCQPGDVYSKELGLAMCISKKFLGNKGNFNEEFKKWIPEEPVEESVEEPVKGLNIKTTYPPIGTKIRIIDGGYGALCANGRIGIVTVKVSQEGLLHSNKGYNVDCGDCVYRIRPDAKIEIIDEKTSEGLSIEDMKNAIKHFCSRKRCGDCPIYELPGRNNLAVGCYDNATRDEYIIENYNAIKDLIKEDKKIWQRSNYQRADLI